MAAQVAHAAGESVSACAPVPVGTHAVILSATSEELHALEQRLGAAGVAHAAVRENDAPYENELLAIGLTPARRAALRPYVSSFRLLRKEAC